MLPAMSKATILIADDERLIRWSLAERLSAEGYATVEAESGRQTLARFDDAVDLVLLDYRLGDTDGLHVLQALRQRDPDVLVIVLTAYSDVETAVAVMKQGAYHYVTKPFNLDEITLLVGKALETTRLRRELRAIRASQREPYSLDRIIGDSRAVAEVKKLLGKIAASPASTVLLTGETGTGKDLAAKVIHYTSARAARPFMNITCSALTETLLESQLFGHERGAFTDAKQQKRGLLESADGGYRLPRRDRRDGAAAAIQAPALPRGEDLQARRGRDRHRRRRARHRGDQPGPGAEGARRNVPGRSLLSPRRAAREAAAAARPGRRRPGARPVLRRRIQPRVPQERGRYRHPRPSRRCSVIPGPATCASCGTRSNARCC